MPIAKNRGVASNFIGGTGNHPSTAPTTAAATTTTTTSSSSSSAANNNNSPSSLLKIESVLPMLSRNPSKSIYRSYSTLSSGYFKKQIPDNNTAPTHAAATTNNRGPTDCDSVINRMHIQQGSINGFWHIQRSNKEKEKLPDRINLDRRGLTSLPIVDDEPNLRLLSLQHNLINTFCVPEYQSQQQHQLVAPPPPVKNISTTKIDDRCAATPPSSKPSAKRLLPKNAKAHQLLLQKSSAKNLLLNTGAAATMATTTATATSNGVGATSIMKNSFVQKSVFYHSKGKFVFKKSNSFINSYSHHLLNPAKRQLSRLNEGTESNSSSSSSTTPPPPPLKGGQLTNMQSIDGGSSSSCHEEINDCRHTTAIVDSASSGPTNQQPPSIFAIIPTNNLQNLVFIDLYDNQIEKISTLDGLKSLTVLLLGKNRITDISGIVCVKNTLRVLDLHGNRIASIAQKICQLQELKSLNLAGNCLRQIHADDFKGLFNLRELNLKRNKIKKLAGFEDLRTLERLWLCHNDLQQVEDMSSIAKAINLKEVTIENNPVSLGGDCVSFLVSYLPALILLSQMQVTEQVRRAAMAWRKSKETTDANYSHLSCDVGQSMRREEIISNARTNWELLRCQQHVNKSAAAASYIQNKIRNTSQQPMSEVDGLADVYGGNETNSNDTPQLQPPPSKGSHRLSAHQRQKAMIAARKKGGGPTKHFAASPIVAKRSSSQDNLQASSAEVLCTPPEKTTADDFFRLPPILAPLFDENCVGFVPTMNGSKAERTPDELSSRTNVIESSSSCVSSDNEETKPMVAGQQQQPMMVPTKYVVDIIEEKVI